MIPPEKKSNWKLPARRCCWIAFLLWLGALAELSAANHIVRMQNTRFVPRDITISVGDSITWTNLDLTGHDSVSGTNGVPSGRWATPLFGRGGAATVTFTNIPAGSYGYYCTPHVFVGMVGSVTVLPANTPPVAEILDPPNGAVVPAGVSLTILADALDADGRVVRVDFSVDGTFLSSDSFGPFTATYANPTAGGHVIQAVAVDDRGATSAPVSVTITALEPPVITQPPTSTNVFLGDPAGFSILAQGEPPLSFQWQFFGTNIPGATNSTFGISAVTLADQGPYTVTVSNTVGVVTSPPASLSLDNAPPVITRFVSPAPEARFPTGGSVSVVVEANDVDGEVKRVRFSLDGVVKADATNSPWSTTIDGLTAGDHIISAFAIDDEGLPGDTANQSIRVFDGPLVTVTEPFDGAVFTQLSAIVIVAEAAPPLTVTNVEFYANDFSLTAVPVVPSAITNPIPYLWQPGALGHYTLTATATDEFGRRSTSAPVAIEIIDPTDDLVPTLTLTSSHPNFARLTTTNVVWLAGTASDDRALRGIELFHSTQFSGTTNVRGGDTNWFLLGTVPPATRMLNWQTQVQLQPGRNTIRVRSVDLATNYSPVVTRYFTFVSNAVLRVFTNGVGSISPNLDNRSLEIGKTYRLTAKPGRSQIFDGWDGVLAQQGAILDFVMTPDLRLTARFSESPFLMVAGSYAGLILDANTNPPSGDAFLTMQVSESGSFSGRLLMAGRNHLFRGTFDQEGYGFAVVLRPASAPIALTMNLDLHGATGVLTGAATNGNWVADLRAYRNPYATGTNSSPYVGRRNCLWRVENSNELVAGTLFNLSSRGKVTLKGTFLTGRRATATSSISADGRIPVAFSSDRFDSLLGWVKVEAAPDLSLMGDGKLIPPGTNNVPVTLTVPSAQ